MSFARAADGPPLFRICFVCTGNICRSPMAETVFKALVARAGLENRITVSSAGTGDWHVGEPSDPRTLAALIDVPDPYYSDAALFDQVLSMIERACASLFRQIKPGIRQGAP